MPFEMELERFSKYLVVNYLGEYHERDLAKLVSSLENLSDICLKEGILKIMINLTSLDMKRMSEMDRFFYAEKGAKLFPAFKKYKVAVVTKISDYSRFGENIAVNRMVYIKFFNRKEDAINWLLV
jgi:hypothetical protein